MKLTLEILRRKPGEQNGHWERYPYETEDDAETVATALTKLNERDELKRDPIRWECSCLQKKCGACAMVLNGKPGLACDARLSEYKDTLRIEPLRKFPVVADLIVDRQSLYDNLREMELWFDSEAEMHERVTLPAYEASRCLQCGCCLEVCPNFYVGGRFAGMAAAMPSSRLLSEMTKQQRKDLVKAYDRRVYEGCGKSLACRDVCPAGIDIEGLLVKSNSVAIWKSIFGKKNNT